MFHNTSYHAMWSVGLALLYFMVNHCSPTKHHRCNILFIFYQDSLGSQDVVGDATRWDTVWATEINMAFMLFDYWYQLLTSQLNLYKILLKKYTNSDNSDSVEALEHFSAIFTLPQINLDVLHPSGDYMESWPVINFLCGDGDRAQANLNERIKKKKNGTRFLLPPPPQPHSTPTSLSPFPYPAHPLPALPAHPCSLSCCLSLSLAHSLCTYQACSLSLLPPFLSMGKQVIMSCHRKVTH